jgi:hypothetical protein
MSLLTRAAACAALTLALVVSLVQSSLAGPLPAPHLVYVGSENYTAGGQAFTRYKLAASNRAYTDALFAPSPNLPPCGLNRDSARTWVDVFDRAGTRLYGFCALHGVNDLGSLWFAEKQGTAPPPLVYIVITDRLTHQSAKSNYLHIP